MKFYYDIQLTNCHKSRDASISCVTFKTDHHYSQLLVTSSRPKVYRPFNMSDTSDEVSTTVPERIPITLRQRVLSTLTCFHCKLLFRAPVSTCALGHSNCYTCTIRFNQCGSCFGELITFRNHTIESLLSLIDVECGHSLCCKSIKALHIYAHYAQCEFRPIKCRLPIATAEFGRGGARIDCAATTSFEDYVKHLTEIHHVSRFYFTDPCGLYDFTFEAKFEDFFRSPETILALAVPTPVLVSGKQFLLHGQLQRQGFVIWISAMFSEEEAITYLAIIQLIPVRNFDRKTKYPKWEILPHNYHYNCTSGSRGQDYVTIHPTLLRRYAQVENGRWKWTVLYHLSKAGSSEESTPIIVEEID